MFHDYVVSLEAIRKVVGNQEAEEALQLSRWGEYYQMIKTVLIIEPDTARAAMILLEAYAPRGEIL